MNKSLMWYYCGLLRTGRVCRLSEFRSRFEGVMLKLWEQEDFEHLDKMDVCVGIEWDIVRVRYHE